MLKLCTLLFSIAACGFPRPADVGDDLAGCTRDEDCGTAQPFCVDRACAVCRLDTSCPAALPVCDQVSHDCRGCAKDSECDSGACDLAAGACVGQGAILYASPAGTAADPCTRMSPCSLRRAAELVDAGHGYIVLEPGVYRGGALFSGKRAIIAGSNATVDIVEPAVSTIGVFNASSIKIRDLNLEEHITIPDSDVGFAIASDTSELVVDDFRSNTLMLYAFGGDSLTIRNSEFAGPSVRATKLVVEGCFFHSGGPVAGDESSGVGFVQLTNSIVIASAPQVSVAIYGNDPLRGSQIVNNTFVGGAFICQATSAGYGRLVDSNVFYQGTAIQASTGCEYRNNLVFPSVPPDGTGNITGDPLFMDLASNDFRLKPGSPAIDAGNPVNTLTGRDFAGTLRPQGARSDIGAFEYVPR